MICPLIAMVTALAMRMAIPFILVHCYLCIVDQPIVVYNVFMTSDNSLLHYLISELKGAQLCRWWNIFNQKVFWRQGIQNAGLHIGVPIYTVGA